MDLDTDTHMSSALDPALDPALHTAGTGTGDWTDSTDSTDSTGSSGLVGGHGEYPMRPVDIRRAILRVFLEARRPLSIDEVVAGVAADGVNVSRRKVSDVMRHQARVGHAQVHRRGTYSLDPTVFSTSTRWRCIHWRAAKAWRERPYSRYRSQLPDSIDNRPPEPRVPVER